MPLCPGHHCSAISDEINAICKEDGFSGNVVYVQHDGEYCYCNCSCVAVDTLVAVPDQQWKRMGDFTVGDRVMALDPAGSWTEAEVRFSNGTGSGDNTAVPYAIFVALGNGSNLIVTADHPFLLHTGQLQIASRLAPDDRLLDQDQNPIEIVSLEYGEYVGGIHNISTSVGPPGEDLSGHLINTAGVVSGDYYAQLYLVSDQALEQPAIGMPEYAKAHRTALARKALRPRPATAVPNDSRFTPHQPFVPPQDAVSFLPDWMKSAAPNTLRPLDDTVPLEIAKYLITHFDKSYPELNYHVHWNDNDVNAYAWMDGYTRHVAILGGLIRHRSIDIQGLSLVIAHEIAHHYGGPPTYPNNPWASCEGQSDYWGALVAMREVWWGEDALAKIKTGADQLYELLAHGLASRVSEQEAAARLAALGRCGHPPADCRRDTYIATLSLDPKPSCAG